MSGKVFDRIHTGDSHTLEKTITEEMVGIFADLTGDYNPVHTDDAYCREHGTGSRMVHGMLTLSFLSTLVGMHLPGNGSVWMSQSMDFITPVRIGETIRITGTVTGKESGGMLPLDMVHMKVDITGTDGRKIARGRIRVAVR